MATRTKRSGSSLRRGETAALAEPPKNRTERALAPWIGRTAEPRMAPGGPGAESRWAAASKSGVGTALSPGGGPASRVWFTVGQGVLTEVFYPRVDRAATRSLELVVTDGREFVSPERTDCERRLEYPAAGVPLYRLINICRAGRYRIEKTVFSHPRYDAVLLACRFTAQAAGLDSYHLHVLLAPHLGNRGAGNTAWLGEHRGIPMLFAERAGRALALGCTAPWIKGSAGYVGVSDGWQDLAQHKRLTWEYDRAEAGNVALAGELDVGACGGVFALALGFGLDPAEAGHQALASLLDDPAKLEAEYVRNWEEWQAKLTIPRLAGRKGGDLGRISTAVLRVHEAAAAPGAIIASLSTPWGEARGDERGERGTGGYHLVWPRDLVQAAGGHLAAGAHDEAARVLRHLQATQLPDGQWPQNMWVSGAAFRGGIQLGEIALPVLLVDLLTRERVLLPADLKRYWPMVRRAARYIVRCGPSTQEDRWENENGHTPFTLATVIAALLVAAELADGQNEPAVAAFLRETADAWNAAIESWLYVVDTELARRIGVEGYYARIIPPELAENSTPRIGHLRRPDADIPTRDRPVPGVGGPDSLGPAIPIDEIVSPDALALVRFGLRSAHDPPIVNTVKVIDALLKVETPNGPAWRRYNGDGYGEKADGSPFDPKTRGIGRAWPLLTGERAHYELAAGRRDEAMRLLQAMESLAGDGGMIPEQVWDAGDIPERGLFKGRPTGSAMPLVWAHAEYLKLRRSLRDGRTFDQPAQTARRYLDQKVRSNLAIWRFDHQRRALSPGEILRIEVPAPAVVRWTHDGWHSVRETPTRDTGLGIHIADLETDGLLPEGSIEFTFYWPEADRWEERNFSLTVF